MLFLLGVVTEILIDITSLNQGMNYIKALFEIFVVGLCYFHKHKKDLFMTHSDFSGLHMSFSDWRSFCREAWQKRYNSIQIDKDKDLDDKNSNKNVSGLEITAVPVATAF